MTPHVHVTVGRAVAPASRRSPGPGGKGDSRVEVLRRGERVLGLVAGASNGSAEGWRASGILADHFVQTADLDMTPAGLGGLLTRADAMVGAEMRGWADASGIVLCVTGHAVTGASAGDAQAFVIGSDWREATENQSPRPRIGLGANVRTFGVVLDPGETLVAATVGLWNWLGRKAVSRIVGAYADVGMVARALADAVRDGNDGRLPDDLGILVVRAAS